MKTLAIMITAFNAEKYILETINSLKDQTLPIGWQTKFYIGVDACEKTAVVLKKNKIPYFYAEKNVGTYILTNSLIKEAQKDNVDVFLRFDSDDIACERFLQNGIENVELYKFVRPYHIITDENLNVINNTIRSGHGSMFATKEAIEVLGGYYHYRVGCDTNFFRRAERLGYGQYISENKPIYLYRQHTNSLMKDSSLGKGSEIRKQYWAEMTEKFNAGENTIKDPMTTYLRYNS